MANVVVAPGDCLSSIAKRFGLTWPILWNAPENAGLRAKRKDPNILYPGDQVFVPETQAKQDPAATGRRHTYEVDIEPTFVKLRFLFMGLPRKNVRWALMLSDREMDSGVTDGDGFLESRIDARQDEARLRLFPRGRPARGLHRQAGPSRSGGDPHRDTAAAGQPGHRSGPDRRHRRSKDPGGGPRLPVPGQDQGGRDRRAGDPELLKTGPRGVRP